MKRTENVRHTRVLAIASAGGHWQQLMVLRSAFEDCDVLFATTLAGLSEEFDAAPAVVIPDISRDSLIKLPWAVVSISYRLLKFRPDIVISTGALPGLLALVLAKGLGKRTVWIDSLANAETISMSGKLARRFSDLWVTQWPDLAQREDAKYFGAVL
ncbi:Oligosaccharide biosynthesis protein Alg14 like [Roseivivax lentus]|uniref:Oligosaccharide biosynthesis protein Alg14 like n=1 Tax=Roseivivax lentus TaxID=633194 RepID=A0A1N7Q1X8_9RHOB|nr:UDP-N-acetylglucosamine--LPS N-acetylglucosamine transferase [Roseivivax lentus]SIT16894.1 Oligosaccharide biosynthesis protein Alg14 like [Roseivivax lentus]